MRRLTQLRKALWKNWLDRRIPLTNQLSLSHRSVFILPTRAGVLFFALLLVMLVTGINYQNSLIFALVFWLFSLALIAMLLTFRNLAGLSIRSAQAQPTFVNDWVSLPLFLGSKKRPYEAIYLGFSGQQGVYSRVTPEHEQEISLRYQPKQRGQLRTERIRIESRFPFGLFRAWSWVQLDFQGVVYPQPEYAPMILSSKGDEEANESGAQQQGDQEFHGLRQYQAGDSLKRIAWKHLARGKGLVTKEFNELYAGEYYFRYQDLSGLDVETRLSRLCAWILDAQEQGFKYGLELPGQVFELNHGQHHLAQCLSALAYYGTTEGKND